MVNRMSQQEYEETIRYYGFHLIMYPLLVCIAIFTIGSVIEILFKFELGVAKTIFIAIGGIGYFIFYFKNELGKKR